MIAFFLIAAAMVAVALVLVLVPLLRQRAGPGLAQEASNLAVLRDQRKRATDDAGVWKLPDGDAYYRWALRWHTTSDLGPDEVHEIGRAEVARIREEMRQAFADARIELGAEARGRLQQPRHPPVDAVEEGGNGDRRNGGIEAQLDAHADRSEPDAKRQQRHQVREDLADRDQAQLADTAAAR